MTTYKGYQIRLAWNGFHIRRAGDYRVLAVAVDEEHAKRLIDHCVSWD